MGRIVGAGREGDMGYSFFDRFNLFKHRNDLRAANIFYGDISFQPLVHHIDPCESLHGHGMIFRQKAGRLQCRLIGRAHDMR